MREIIGRLSLTFELSLHYPQESLAAVEFVLCSSSKEVQWLLSFLSQSPCIIDTIPLCPAYTAMLQLSIAKKLFNIPDVSKLQSVCLHNYNPFIYCDLCTFDSERKKY